jgi:hypothetical protein
MDKIKENETGGESSARESDKEYIQNYIYIYLGLSFIYYRQQWDRMLVYASTTDTKIHSSYIRRSILLIGV